VGFRKALGCVILWASASDRGVFALVVSVLTFVDVVDVVRPIDIVVYMLLSPPHPCQVVAPCTYLQPSYPSSQLVLCSLGPSGVRH